MAEHTPGRWEVGVGLLKDAPGQWFAVGVQGNPWSPVAVLSSEASVNDTDRANANLIAAAPDLLAALKTTAGNIRSLGPAGALPDSYSVWLRVVNAAIAKAEGATHGS